MAKPFPKLDLCLARFICGITLLLGAPACATGGWNSEPTLGGDFAIGAGPSAGPRLGFAAGLSQRLYQGSDLDIHVELELHRQELEATTFEGERFDGSWDQVRGGFKFVRPAEGNRAWTGRFGVTWIRPDGDPVFVDKPTDFGGFYLGVGQDRMLTRRILFTPDLALIGLFEESDGEVGLGLQLSLRFFWLP